MLSGGEADAGFLVLAPEARTIQRLMRAPRVRLMSFVNAESYTQRFPFLSRLVLREGVVDLAANLPPADVTLIATTAAVLVREDAHPALVNLLAQAMQEVHGQPATDTGGETPLFQRAGEFPVASDPEFTLSDEARRVYRSGAPLLQRYVPFWVATMIDRLTVSLVVLLPVLLPLVRFAPQIYNWRIRRRILYWYGELKRLEAAARRAGSQHGAEANVPSWIGSRRRSTTFLCRWLSPTSSTSCVSTSRSSAVGSGVARTKRRPKRRESPPVGEAAPDMRYAVNS